MAAKVKPGMDFLSWQIGVHKTFLNAQSQSATMAASTDCWFEVMKIDLYHPKGCKSNIEKQRIQSNGSSKMCTHRNKAT